MYINIYLHYVEGDTIEGDTLILYLTDTSAGNDTVDDDSNDIVLLRLNTVLLHQLLLLLLLHYHYTFVDSPHRP